ncbi:hypothetical protein A8C56_11005 [Niabella ginsenosidivorans]|uniref:Uncharacterized protein n=1 Tax=Niabella ginsenosidivorans TaxID=1176587 RepID=A0A1A9I194_9BACT|nr:hypothetical protein A8C56_11005 [Niabella ginsenosidivorans]
MLYISAEPSHFLVGFHKPEHQFLNEEWIATMFTGILGHLSLTGTHKSVAFMLIGMIIFLTVIPGAAEGSLIL